MLVRSGDFGIGLDGFVKCLDELGYADAYFLEKELGAVFTGLQYPFDHVRRIDRLLLKAGGESLSCQDCFLGVDGKVIVCHGLSMFVIAELSAYGKIV